MTNVQRRLSPRLLSIEEAAEYTGFTVRYLRRLIFERRIAYHKDRQRVWFTREDLDAYVRRLRVEPASDEASLPRARHSGRVVPTRR